MPKLNETQKSLLAHAAKQHSSLYPLPEALTKKGAIATRTIKATEQLVELDLIEERQTSIADQVTHTEGDIGYGKFITAAGLAAIGGDGSGADAALPAPVDSGPRQTKSATVLALLQRDDGATMEELIAATGWLPHTTRAALTGLRKKGHAVERSKRGEITCYRVVVAA